MIIDFVAKRINLIPIDFDKQFLSITFGYKNGMSVSDIPP